MCMCAGHNEDLSVSELTKRQKDLQAIRTIKESLFYEGVDESDFDTQGST